MKGKQAFVQVCRFCIDNVFTPNELIQGNLKEAKKTFAFFLDIQKAYDLVWRNGLWLTKVMEYGSEREDVACYYDYSRNAVILGEKSPTFSVEQRVAQGCSLSPIFFSVFISDLLP